MHICLLQKEKTKESINSDVKIELELSASLFVCSSIFRSSIFIYSDEKNYAHQKKENELLPISALEKYFAKCSFGAFFLG